MPESEGPSGDQPLSASLGDFWGPTWPPRACFLLNDVGTAAVAATMKWF